jgi:hypothetical protein
MATSTPFLITDVADSLTGLGMVDMEREPRVVLPLLVSSISFAAGVMGSRSGIETAGTEEGRGHSSGRSLQYLLRWTDDICVGARGELTASSWAIGMSVASTARPLASGHLFHDLLSTNC